MGYPCKMVHGRIMSCFAVLLLFILAVLISLFLLFKTNCTITKTRLYNFDPLEPHFYIVKLGLTGYTLFFIFLLKNIDCGYSLEPPRWGGSNEYPQSMFWAEIWKMSEFLSENFHFLVVKFSTYLNRHVFVMQCGILVVRQSFCVFNSKITSLPLY